MTLFMGAFVRCKIKSFIEDINQETYFLFHFNEIHVCLVYYLLYGCTWLAALMVVLMVLVVLPGAGPAWTRPGPVHWKGVDLRIVTFIL